MTTAISSTTLQTRLLSHARFRHMQVMVAIAEMGSLRRAADSIGLSQPAVSKVVADLEALLGIALFRRHARGVVPTEGCRELLVLARQTVNGVASAAEAVAARTRLGEGTVRVAGTVAAINGLLVQWLPRFIEAAPDVQVQVWEGRVDDVLLAAARGEVDLVLCRRPGLVPVGWEFCELLADEFKVFCSPCHRLLRRKRVSLSDLMKQRWLPGHAGAASRAWLERLARDAGQELQICELLTLLPTTNWSLLRRSELLMLAPASVFQPYLSAGELATIALPQPLPFDPLGMMLRTEAPGEATRRLASFLQDRFGVGR